MYWLAVRRTVGGDRTRCQAFSGSTPNMRHSATAHLRPCAEPAIPSDLLRHDRDRLPLRLHFLCLGQTYGEHAVLELRADRRLVDPAREGQRTLEHPELP